ncbi:MAG: hypothetical protein GKS07_07380 [Nitrosopumilus sp.]|nr:MAG: hypothetical protein GKS07_07380 [Nitrosopumilus sp.]
MRSIYFYLSSWAVRISILSAFSLILVAAVYLNSEGNEEWIVELEPHLDLKNDMKLRSQMSSDNIEQLKIIQIIPLDDYVRDFHPERYDQLEEADLFENRYVYFVINTPGFSDEEIIQTMMKFNGIKHVERPYWWISDKD